MQQIKSKNIQSQSGYPEESAGRLMTVNVPVVHEDATIGDIERTLLKKGNRFETINYIYLVDAQNKLKGIVSIKDLFHYPKAQAAKELFPKNIVTANAYTDQEQVALLALKHNIKAVPVVDTAGKLLGVVTSDTILSVLHSENVEDALRFAGAMKIDNPAVNIIKAKSWFHFRKRLPWLVIGLFGGLATAIVVRYFEGTLEEQIAIAAFIPVVVYMADAVGTQTQTIFIRSLALTHDLDMKKYVWREFKVNLSLAILLGLLIFGFSFLWIGSGTLSTVLGISIMLTVLTAMLVAITLPWLFQKFHYDPAIASGPFATIIRDITSLLIYFAVVSLLL